MPNVCVIASADGDIETIEVDNWPDWEMIQEMVGGMFVEVPTSFKMEFDESWGEQAGKQDTVVYCNESGLLNGLAVNQTPIAQAINRELGANGPLVGDILVVSGGFFFMQSQD